MFIVVLALLAGLIRDVICANQPSIQVVQALCRPILRGAQRIGKAGRYGACAKACCSLQRFIYAAPINPSIKIESLMDAHIFPWPPETMLLVGGAFLLAGLVKGTLGLGLPVVVIAILAPTIGLQSAIGLILLPSIALNIWQSVVGGNLIELIRRLWPMMLLSMVGVWFGAQILAATDPHLMLTVLALVLITYSVGSLMRAQIRPPGRFEVVLTPIMGFFGGLMFGMVGNFMVPGVLYLQALNLGRDRLVQALGMSFIALSVTMLISMSRFELVDRATLIVSAAAMAPGMLGMMIGQGLRRYLNEGQFRRLFFSGLLIAGIYMMIKAQLS
jgi:uncharacterized membrane protein YfcA